MESSAGRSTEIAELPLLLSHSEMILVYTKTIAESVLSQIRYDGVLDLYCTAMVQQHRLIYGAMRC